MLHVASSSSSSSSSSWVAAQVSAQRGNSSRKGEALREFWNKLKVAHSDLASRTGFCCTLHPEAEVDARLLLQTRRFFFFVLLHPAELNRSSVGLIKTCKLLIQTQLPSAKCIIKLQCFRGRLTQLDIGFDRKGQKDLKHDGHLSLRETFLRASLHTSPGFARSSARLPESRRSGRSTKQRYPTSAENLVQVAPAKGMQRFHTHVGIDGKLS